MPDDAIEAEKAAARALARASLASMPPGERAADSRAIVRRLLRLPLLEDPGVVLAYLALPDEPDLDAFIADRLAAGLPVAGPRADWIARTMTPALIDDLEQGVRLGRHNLREPVGPSAPLDAVVCVLVPGLAFDESGARLGRGGGFYDRFIAGLDRTRAAAVGVAFDAQIVPDLPMLDHDARLDAVVTPTRIVGPHADSLIR